MISLGRCKSAGLLGTTVIKQVGNRRVLERIDESGRIFFAVPDRKWFDNGVAIRIDIIGIDLLIKGSGGILDGQQVSAINPNLTSGCDLSGKRRLANNVGLY